MLRLTQEHISQGIHTVQSRPDVRRHQESTRRAKMAKSKGLYGEWHGPVAYVVNGKNKVDGVTRAETMFAYWIAHHNLPTCRTRIQH